MRKTKWAAILTLCGAMALAGPVAAQEITSGNWTGELTPPNAPTPVAVNFVVDQTDGQLTIVMSNLILGEILLTDERIDGDELTFSFAPDPNTAVDCTLTRQEDRSFDGTCVDERGADAAGQLTMRPPEG